MWSCRCTIIRQLQLEGSGPAATPTRICVLMALPFPHAEYCCGVVEGCNRGPWCGQHSIGRTA